MRNPLIHRIAAVIIIAIALQSCGSISVLYNQSASMTGEDFSMTTIEIESQVYRTESKFVMPLSFGYTMLNFGAGPINLNNRDYSLPAATGMTFGLTPTYNFTRTRFQPFMALKMGMGAFFADEITDNRGTSVYIDEWSDYGGDGYYQGSPLCLFAIPQLGARCFLTRNLAIVANAGYHFTGFLYDNDTKNYFSGVAISFGLTYAF